MNDTPGWASPGSDPSGGDGREPGEPRPAEPADGTGPAPGGQEPGAGSEGAGPGATWSKQQPPPASWSSPGPQGPAQAPPPGPGGGAQGPGGWGGPGQGGPGGWGGPGPAGGYGWGAWQGRPPAAKPGVIPLRPLGLGEILDGAVSTMRTYWRSVLGISLTVAAVIQLATVLVQGLALRNTADSSTLSDPNASVGDLSRAMGDTMLNSAVVAVIALLGTIIATAMLTMVMSRAVLGKPVTVGEAWRDARPRLLRLLGLTLLLPLIAGVILTLGIVPGVAVAASGSTDAGIALAFLGALGAMVVAVWLTIRFSLASPALMLEKQGVLKSMGRSVKLVRGSWWRIFGIQLLAVVVADIIAAIIVIPFTLVAGAVSGDGIAGFLNGSGSVGWTFLVVTGIGTMVGRTLTLPIIAGVTVLLYIDRRIRREALDLELARAAGVENHGTAAPGTVPGS
ncbi:DUF7544 domain-containing protein [Streptomyces sp. NPDC002004]